MYPPPHMEYLLAQLAGKKVFSKLDFGKGYYQVPVAQQDVPKMAVITPFWAVQVSQDALWAQECLSVLPVLHG